MKVSIFEKYIYILAGALRRAWYGKWLMLSHIRTLSNLLPLLRYSGLPNKGKSGKSRDPTKVLAFKQGSRLFYTIYPLVKSSSYLLKTLYRDCVIGRVDSLTTIFFG